MTNSMGNSTQKIEPSSQSDTASQISTISKPPSPENHSSQAAARDTPEIARKREREARTVSQMIAIYCKGHHPKETCTQTSYSGEALCEECKTLDDYAVLRTMRCRKMGEKVDCELCENHCYAKESREKIREVMRYSGPRMMKAHPIAAIRHLAGKLKSK